MAGMDSEKRTGMERIGLWEFPPSDFAAWRALVGDLKVTSHDEYVTMLTAVQANLERMGTTVVRVRMSVAEMKSALVARGLENTPGNRTAVLLLER
jgi:hypothetical protein